MKRTQRDPLKELVQRLRVPEEGACNLGAFLFDHADDLASALGSTGDDLRASVDMPDEVVGPRIRARLGRRREMSRDKKALDDHEVAGRAAIALGRTARWTAQGAILDTELLLGDLLADRAVKYVSFKGADFIVAVERNTLARTAMVQRLFIDVAAYVGADGLHVRWRGGRGGFNWKARFVARADLGRVLTVELQPSVRAAVPRPGAWLREPLTF